MSALPVPIDTPWAPPDGQPTEVMMAVDADTCASPTCESASVEAWSDELNAIDLDRQTWRKTLFVATTLAVAGGVVGSAVWFGHLAWTRGDQGAPTTTAAPTLQPTITTVVAAPTPAPPSGSLTTPPAAPPPVTVTVEAPPTTVQAPASTVTVPVAVPPADLGAYDQAFLSGLMSMGYNIWDSALVLRNAHEVCRLVRNGVPAEQIHQQYMAATGQDLSTAVMFASRAMQTYPDCP